MAFLVMQRSAFAHYSPEKPEIFDKLSFLPLAVFGKGETEGDSSGKRRAMEESPSNSPFDAARPRGRAQAAKPGAGTARTSRNGV